MLVTGAGVDRHSLTARTPHSRLSRAFLESFDTVPRVIPATGENARQHPLTQMPVDSVASFNARIHHVSGNWLSVCRPHRVGHILARSRPRGTADHAAAGSRHPTVIHGRSNRQGSPASGIRDVDAATRDDR